MKTDRELLELAAKAAGYDFLEWAGETLSVYWGNNCFFWNPLKKDGDAFRLAIKLKMHIETMDKWESSAEDDLGYSKELSRTVVGFEHQELIESHEQDAYAATRRAIVRAAAAIGEQMQ